MFVCVYGYICIFWGFLTVLKLYPCVLADEQFSMLLCVCVYSCTSCILPGVGACLMMCVGVFMWSYAGMHSCLCGACF